MPELVDSREQSQTALFNEQCFEKIIQEDDDPTAEECKQGREEEGCPHSFAIAQRVEASRGELTGSCWTVTHPSACTQHSEEENAFSAALQLEMKRRNAEDEEKERVLRDFPIGLPA